MKSNVKRLFAGPYILWMIGFTIIPLLLIVYYGLTTKRHTDTDLSCTLRDGHQHDIHNADTTHDQ